MPISALCAVCVCVRSNRFGGRFVSGAGFPSPGTFSIRTAFVPFAANTIPNFVVPNRGDPTKVACERQSTPLSSEVTAGWLGRWGICWTSVRIARRIRLTVSCRYHSTREKGASGALTRRCSLPVSYQEGHVFRLFGVCDGSDTRYLSLVWDTQNVAAMSVARSR